jgi:hypothetical protein
MLDSKFLFTLIGLIISVVAISKTNFKPDTKENFWGLPAFKTKVMTEVYPKGLKGGGQYTLPNHHSNTQFVSHPNFQPVMSPRFGNTQYGAEIRYNPPALEHQGVPQTPLAFGDMAQENYQENYHSPKSPTCGKWGKTLPGTRVDNNYSGYQDKNFTTEANKVYAQGGPVITDLTPSDLVPVGDMTTIQADGTESQFQVYDRHIFANLRGRLQGHGDPIRGDLAIMPPPRSGWFNVSANPQLDLRQGAMAVMGGAENQTGRALADLVFESSGGTNNIIGGFDYGESLDGPIGMNNQFTTKLGSGMSDVKVTAFP